MERKPQPADRPPDQPPSPMFVAAVSLFGYPGGGHFLVGRKRLGFIFAILFTATTLGVVYEIWELLPELLKLMKRMVDMQEAFTIPAMPNLPRMALWIVLSTAIWIASAVHSAMLARAQQPPAAPTN